MRDFGLREAEERESELAALRSTMATYDGIFAEQNAIFKRQLEEIERLRGALETIAAGEDSAMAYEAIAHRALSAPKATEYIPCDVCADSYHPADLCDHLSGREKKPLSAPKATTENKETA